MAKKMFTARVESENPVHTRVKVYNYGGYSGTLVVNTDDADELIRRLTGAAQINQRVDTIGAGAQVTGIKIERFAL